MFTRQQSAKATQPHQPRQGPYRKPSTCRADPLAQDARVVNVVGRGHASLLTNSDTWHSKRAMGIQGSLILARLKRRPRGSNMGAGCGYR
jgi:hypothetical protein